MRRGEWLIHADLFSGGIIILLLKIVPVFWWSVGNLTMQDHYKYACTEMSHSFASLDERLAPDDVNADLIRCSSK